MRLMEPAALFLVVAGLPFALARPARASARDACKAALALEERGAKTDSSAEPCKRAFLDDGRPEDMRNEVAAMMSPAAHPSLDDLVLAATISEAAIRQASDQPWGYLARCDLARRLGSAATLETCLADLQRFGPNHAATKQALGFASERSSAATWLLRGLLLVGLLGTLVHALVQSRARRRGEASTRAVLGLLVLFGTATLLSVSPHRAHAESALPKDHLSAFEIDDEDPESSVPSDEEANKKPLEFGYYIQDLAAKAEKAGQAGDHVAEARYYAALSKAAPAVAYAPSKLCSAYEAAGNIPKAIAACRTAITRRGSTAADYTHFVNVVLSSHDKLPALEEEELRLVINHLAGESKVGDPIPSMLRCEVALRFGNTQALQACTAELATSAPTDPKTVSFQWALALQKHDRSAALQLIERARGVGMKPEGIAMMEAGTRKMTLRWLMWAALFATGAILLGTLLWFGYLRFGNRRQAAVS